MTRVKQGLRASGSGLAIAGSILAMIAAPNAAIAQTADAPPSAAPSDQPGVTSPPGATEEIVVTGSRLTRSGFTAPTPVTALSGAELQRNGDTNIGVALNRLPAFRPQNTPATQGFTQSGGLAVQLLDLRGLGAVRTLVLLDGRRSAPTTTQGTFDLSFVPSNMIARAEVVTGGASAAYGSDAVAGVVNLILDNKFSGVKAQAQYGLAREGDNKEIQASAAIGSDIFDGRGHIVIAGEFVRNRGLGDCFSRKWCSPDGLGDYYSIQNTAPGASGLPANIFGLVRTANMNPNGLITSTALRGTQFNADGSVSATPWNFGQLATNISTYSFGGDGKNYFHVNLLLAPPAQRYVFYQNLTYDFSSSLKGYINAGYGQVTAQANAAVPLDSGSLVIQRTNAFLPTAIATRMDQLGLTSFNMGRVTYEAGQARTRAKRSNMRIAAGLDGKLGGSWGWDTYYQFGRTDSDQNTVNNKITANFNRAIDSVRNAAGVAVCRSSLTDPTNGCAPINPFGINNISTAAIGYAFGTATQSYKFVQHVAAANVHGDLFNLPGGPISVVGGVEFRRDSALGVGDPISSASGFFTNNTAVINGRIKTLEGYVEGVAPLVKDLPFANLLELNGAVRRTHYSRSNPVNATSTVNATTWKLGAVWEPVDFLRFRATRSRDIRAPNQVELFGGLAASFTFTTDTRAPGGTQSYNVQTFTGGSTALTPERANTTTFGAVLKPAPGWLPGTIRLSADYYKIELKGAIATLGGQLIVNRCASGNAQFCALVTRDATTGLITRILNANLNLNSLRTKGLDLELNYRTPLSELAASVPGTIDLRVLANHTTELSTIDSSGLKTDRAGQTGAPPSQTSGVPTWTIDSDLTYSVGPFSITGQIHWFNTGKYDVTLVGPEDPGYSVTLPNSISTNRVAGRTYANLAASYAITRQVELFGSVRNLFNVKPPVAPSSTGVTNTVLYDIIGQDFRAGFRVKF
jgi:outer membrane receptor protein involved in Fe transport